MLLQEFYLDIRVIKVLSKMKKIYMLYQTVKYTDFQITEQMIQGLKQQARPQREEGANGATVLFPIISEP